MLADRDENQNMSKTKFNSTSGRLPRMDAHDYESKIHEIVEKNEILESKLKHTNDTKSKLLNKLKEFEDDNDRYKDQIARQAYQNKTQEDELNRLNAKIYELQNSNKNLNEKCKTKFEILNKELEEKDDQLCKVISQTKAKDETIKYYSVNNEQIIRYQNQYKTEYENTLKEKSDLEDKIRKLERQIDDLYINRKSEAAMSLEIDHLKEDNIRLLQMLKTTNEFKDFAYLAEDVSGGIRYVRSHIDPSIKRPKSSMRLKDKMNYEKVTPRNDTNWVPMEAYNYAFEFRDKNNLELSDMLLEELLCSLNKIWKEKQKMQIESIKKKYQTEVLDLRRKITMKSNMTDFDNNKTINKLRKDLRNTREDLNKHIVLRNKNIPAGIDLVDNALKVANNFQKTKKHLEGEIKNLREKLNEKGDKPNKESYDRLKFNEGSYWMITRIVNEMESFDNKLQDLIIDYKSRCRMSSNIDDINSKMKQNATTWFIQSLETMIEELVQQLKEWQFNAERNINN